MQTACCLTLLALTLAGASPVGAWQRSLTEPGINAVHALAVDDRGNPVAGGVMAADDGPLAGKFAVVELAAANGVSIWSYTIDQPGSNSVAAVAVDARGDVVAAGQTGFMEIDDQAFGSLTAVKLAGRTGAELWRFDTDAALSASALAVDGHGDVVVVGRGLTVKLDGTTGHELWRVTLDASVYDVAVNRQGDVAVAAGTNASPTAFRVVKLSGDDGAERWRYTFGGPNVAFASRIEFDRHDDVVAAGGVQDAPLMPFGILVAKLRGQSGAERWHHVASPASGPMPEVFASTQALALDGRRDVVIASSLRSAGIDADFTVLKLDRTHGEELWRYSVDGSAHGVDSAYAVAIDRQRDVLAVGSTQAKSPSTLLGSAFVVVKLDHADGHVVWQGDVGAGIATGVAVDRKGDVVAGGLTPNDPGNDFIDFTVVKLRGADGR